MNYFRKCIAVFGIALPVLGIAVIITIGCVIKANMLASFNNKQGLYKTFETTRIEALKIETKIVSQRHHIERWSALLAEESSSSVNNNLRAIAESLPSKEYQKTAFERTVGKAGFGTGTAQRSSQLKIVFRGTFRTMQRAFLELESRMPQLQLHEFRIDPNPNQQNSAPLLTFQVSYTAWEN